jgi:hypothetical protein
VEEVELLPQGETLYLLVLLEQGEMGLRILFQVVIKDILAVEVVEQMQLELLGLVVLFQRLLQLIQVEGVVILPLQVVQEQLIQVEEAAEVVFSQVVLLVEVADQVLLL